MKSASLKVEGICKTFRRKEGDLPVLDGASLSAGPGEFIALVGPSGCGKSTLFNILSGLIRADVGEIFLNGKKTSHVRGSAAYMQQKDLLLPWRTVLDNVILGMEIGGAAKNSARMEAFALLETFGLKGFENRRPTELSGGMKQRAALMRTLLCKKPLLLLDEPFGALDAITRRIMRQHLTDVHLQFGTSVVLVTHDVEEALLLADRVYVMSARPGMMNTEVKIEIGRPRPADHPLIVSRKQRLLSILDEEMSKAG